MPKIAWTGHRPDKLGGYNKDYSALIKFFKTQMESIIPKCSSETLTVITGGALGADQFALEAALQIYDWNGYAVDVIIAEPFPGFWKKWPTQSIEYYFSLRGNILSQVIQVDKDEKYAAWKLQKRNEWMVNRCTELWAFWNGSSGGTANCIAYAKKVGKPIRNLYNDFLS